jgi:hypothetical protein
MYNPMMLVKLIRASHALTEDQKSMFLEKMATLPEVKKYELFEILEKEQKNRNIILKDMLANQKEFERKRAKIIYSYIERKTKEEESDILKNIDAALAGIIN